MTGVNIDEKDDTDQNTTENETLDPHLEMILQVNKLKSIAVVDSIKNFSSNDVSQLRWLNAYSAL